MAQVINTNIMSLMARQNLNKSQNALNNSIQRLSTGYRINSAKDDVSGQGIANRFTSQIRGLTQAIRNANDGISLIQTIESGVSQINDNLQRIRELTVQGLNGTNSMDDLSSIYNEIRDHAEEIQRIGNQVTFNGLHVLNLGENRNPNFMYCKIQVGVNDEQTVIVTIRDMSVQSLNVAKDDSLMPDNGGHNDILTEFVETCINRSHYSSLLGTIDSVISRVDDYRGQLGANQNRFEAIITELNDRVNNLSASRSRIEDTDYATEISNMIHAQILQQASTAVLAQANQAPQTVLSLLQQLMQ